MRSISLAAAIGLTLAACQGSPTEPQAAHDGGLAGSGYSPSALAGSGYSVNSTLVGSGYAAGSGLIGTGLTEPTDPDTESAAADNPMMGGGSGRDNPGLGSGGG